ncbi:MAG: hypothetical protein SCH71_10280 [Desulfobulbaceae bacterium]|nr:hypothetical protein [Desulfobulbaceae bacterium]
MLFAEDICHAVAAIFDDSSRSGQGWVCWSETNGLSGCADAVHAGRLPNLSKKHIVDLGNIAVAVEVKLAEWAVERYPEKAIRNTLSHRVKLS